MKKLILFFGICLVLAGFFVFSQVPQISLITPISPISPTPLIAPIPPISLILLNSPTPLTSFAKVTHVIDGDTIEIETGEKVRYIGVDAAEVYPAQQCFSEEVLSKNKELVLGKVVRLEKDISETDKYGRLLRYVYIGENLINERLVKEGFAKTMIVFPDTKFEYQFSQSEKYAKENKLGLWSICPISP
ncbi:MAG: thermonuclease family protein [Candidatus Woesebacteria bacterium]|nr:thermonuclease family protein [Candidatus Woesebacteria bacterium]